MNIAIGDWRMFWQVYDLPFSFFGYLLKSSRFPGSLPDDYILE